MTVPRCLVVALALAGTLFASQACAQIAAWNDSGPRALDARLTVFGAYAVPRGEFGVTTGPGGGFARPGGGLGLDFSAVFPQDVETGALLLVQWNPTDDGALGEALAAVLRQYGLPSDSIVVSASEWRLTWLLGKAGFAPRVGNDLQVSVDLYGGALLARSPDVALVSGPPGLSIQPYSRSWVSWVGLAGGAGAAVRWREHLKLGLVYATGADQSGWRGHIYSRQPVSTLNATLGYTFGH